MAITVDLSNDRPMLFGGFACGTSSPLVTIPRAPSEIDFCSCNFSCEYIELALYTSGGTKSERNSDTTSVLFNLASNTSTFEIKLINKSTGQETVLNDDTLGTFYNAGDLSQPLKVGYIIDWQLVGTVLGNGTYQISITVTDFGNPITTESHLYKCTPFSDIIADGTVKVVTTNQGIIEGGEDYDGITWSRSVRFDGFFGRPSFTIETTDYEDNDRRLNQNQDSIGITYNLSTDLMPSGVSNQLILNDILANRILIYDYNLLNTEVFEGIEVRPESIDEPEYFENNPNGAYSFVFKTVENKPVKRNKFI